MDDTSLPPAVAAFLRACPEHRADVRFDHEAGPLMNTAAAKAFAEWCVANGLTTADKARHAVGAMNAAARAAKAEWN